MTDRLRRAWAWSRDTASRLVLVAIVLPVIFLGLFMFRMSYDEMAGVLAGATGNPAILAYANKLAPADRPDGG